MALFQNLTSLILRENKIIELPPEIGQLTQLTALDVSHNNLQSLPEGTVYCFQSREGRRGGREGARGRKGNGWRKKKSFISFVSPEIGHCVQLVFLELQHNDLQDLPEAVGNCKSLRRLCLRCV